MKLLTSLKRIGALSLASLLSVTCNKLDTNVYSLLPNEEFWKTPAEVAAGKAPAYQALTGIGGDSNPYYQTSMTSDEMVTPTRGGDWGDGGAWGKPYFHTQLADDGFVAGCWNAIFAGVGKCNFIIYTLENLSPAPATLAADVAEIKAVRSYFFFLGLDLYGNIPYVTNFKIDPTTVVNIPRTQVFDSLENDLIKVIPLLNEATDASTYGKMTKWFAKSILAKMYLNAEVYKGAGTGSTYWPKCVATCDEIINSGKFALEANYYDNFGVNNITTENLMSIPYNRDLIFGQRMACTSIMSNNAYTFGVNAQWGNNGMSITDDYYKNFDTSSVFRSSAVNGFTNVYRTFNDQRSGQILVGQQYVAGITYPPHKNILYYSTNTAKAGDPWDPSSTAIKLFDNQSHLALSYYGKMKEFSNGTDSFRLSGLRMIKWFPQAGNPSSVNGDMMSNQLPLERYSDILLMKAESLMRLGSNLTTAVDLVNEVRQRAYGNASHNWTTADLTPTNMLAERAREFTWELVRRTDVIRFGTFGNAKQFPPKPADADDHLELLPIPIQAHLTNPNLTQNPGYTW
jgi:hypothetical protein